MEERNSFAYFLLGVGVGVAAGMLFAPRSGDETRRYLRDRAEEGTDYLKARTDEGREYIRQRADDLKQTASNIVEKGKSTVQKQRDNITAAMEAGKQAYREAVTDAKTSTGPTSPAGENI
jgi:gas vesicle protein